MLLRGLVWQLLHMRFEGVLFLGRGARLQVDRRVRLKGWIKVGHHATMNLSQTASGRVGPCFSLGDFSIFRASGAPKFTCPQVEIGENVSFGPYCNIGGGFGLTIGRNVIAGPFVSIHPEGHGLDAYGPIREQPIEGIGIHVGADCWLGAKATLLDGTMLASGTVIGAGTIVPGIRTKSNGI